MPPRTQYKSPAHAINQQPFFRGYLEGKADTILLDSGANLNVMSLATARQYNLRHKAQRDISRFVGLANDQGEYSLGRVDASFRSGHLGCIQ